MNLKLHIGNDADLRLETRETRRRVQVPPCSGHEIERLRSPMLTFATKKLSTGANGQREDVASLFSPRNIDRAVIAQSRSRCQWQLRLLSRTVTASGCQWPGPAPLRARCLDSEPLDAQVLQCQLGLPPVGWAEECTRHTFPCLN